MQVLNTRKNLVEKTACFLVWQAFLFYDVVKEFTTWHKLHNQEELPRRLDDFVQLDNIRVSDNFKNLYFSHHSRNIGLVFNFVFLQNLDGHFFLSEHVGADPDLAEGTLTNCLPHEVVADAFVTLLLARKRLRVFTRRTCTI